jgi:hypothetical protein
MTNIVSILTHTTCGEACWSAHEEICRCSCGGKNHGCLKTSEGVRPVRSAKLDGIMYELIAVGSMELNSQAEDINHAVGYRAIDRVNETLVYRYHYRHVDKGAPARIRRATSSQIQAWPELAASRAMTEQERYFSPVVLLWKRVDAAPTVSE